MAAPSPSLQAAEATAQLVEGRDKELPLQAAAAAPRQALPPQPRAPPKAAQQEQQAGPVQNNWQPGDQQWQPLLRPGMEEQSSSAVGNGPGDPNPDGSDVCRKRTAAAEKHYRLLCSAEKALMEKQSEAGPSNTNNATLRTVRSLKERCRQHLGRAGLEDLPEEEPVDPLAARLRAQVSALRCLLSGLPLQGGHAGRSIPLRQPWGSDTNVNNAAEKRKQQEDLQEEHGRLYAAAAALAKEAAGSLSFMRAFCEEGRAARQLQRKQELSTALQEANLSNVDARVKALLELKGLQLLDIQRKVRWKVAAERRLLHKCAEDELPASSILHQTSIGRPWELLEWCRWTRASPDDVHFQVPLVTYRVIQVQPDPPPPQRPLTYFEKQLLSARLKVDGVRREAKMIDDYRNRVVLTKQATLNQRRLFLEEVINYGRDWKSQQSAIQKDRVKHVNGVASWHSRERRRVEREAEARINALKDQNFEEYLRLAQETKNSRLMTLLESTDNIILDLSMKVQEQRGDSDATDTITREELQNIFAMRTDSESTARIMQSQKKYNRLVHNIQENVQQPAGMRNGKLRTYQLDGLKFFVSLYNNKMNGILADEMGLGKTIQTISFVTYVTEVKQSAGPHLILAPKAVLPNWRNEFAKWSPDLKVIFYDGSSADRAVIRAEQMSRGAFNVILTHYDLVIRDKAHLRKFDYELLIVDEGHRLKNSQSKLSDILREHYGFKHRFLLTGTPIQNSIHELWALLNFVLPKVFHDIDSFDDWFAAPFKGSSEDVSQQLNEEESLLIIHRLHQVIRPFLLRRTKAEVEKELPDKTQQIIRCDMSAWQKLIYKQIANKSKIEMGRGKRQLSNQAMQMRKACNHPYLFVNDYIPPGPEEIITASGKMMVLDNILPKLKATGHRVLMFCQMTRQLDILEDYLVMRGFMYMRLDGTTNTQDRSESMEKFNAPGSEYFIFMLSTRAGGLGLNLQTADTVIMFDSDWNPQADQQAEDRAHRIGQKKQVLVLVFVTAGSIEEAIQIRAKEKRDIDAKVIQAGMFNETSTHADRHELLEQLMKQDGISMGNEVHDTEQINILLARSDQELETFNNMDAETESSGKALKLLEEAGIPDWAREVEESEQEKSEPAEEEDQGRRSRRARRDVVYDESLTELQFCDLVESGATPDEIYEVRRKKRDNARKLAGIQALKRARSSSEVTSAGDNEEAGGPRARGTNDELKREAGDKADPAASANAEPALRRRGRPPLRGRGIRQGARSERGGGSGRGRGRSRVRGGQGAQGALSSREATPEKPASTSPEPSPKVLKRTRSESEETDLKGGGEADEDAVPARLRRGRSVASPRVAPSASAPEPESMEANAAAESNTRSRSSPRTRVSQNDDPEAVARSTRRASQRKGKVLFSDDDGREEPASSPGRGTEGRAAEIAASIEPDTSPQKAKEGNQTAGAGLLVPGLVEKATHAPAVGKSEAQVTQPEGSEDNVDAGACAADDSTSQLVDMDSSEAERKGESASVSEGSKGETDAMADQRQDAACGHRAISLKLAVKDLPDADGTAIKQDHPASDTPGASQPTVPTKEATCAETEVAEHQGAEPTSSRSPQTKDVPESLEPIAGNSLQPEDRAVKIPLQDVSPGAPGGGDEMGSATSGSPPSRGEDPTLPESKTAGGALRNRDAAANGGRSGCNKVAPNALTIMGSKGQSSGEDASDAYVA